jgi:pullulanase/glycogen debranching enzyme
MVPDMRLAPGGMAELANCVATLHQAGIEVLLDIVLNHTGEGDQRGPTLSLRGLDNATYYRADTRRAGRYADDTGCGNTLALDRMPTMRLALDVLRHYATVAGIDGFRLDLAATLGRTGQGFDAAAPLLAAIAQDPVLRTLKFVAEPWDLGDGGYRLGSSPQTGASGTTATATRYADSGVGMQAWRANLRRASRVRPTSSPRAGACRHVRSTLWPPTTASRSGIWSRSNASTTKPTAR